MLKLIAALTVMTLLLYGISTAGIPNPAGEEELFVTQDTSAEEDMYEHGTVGVYLGFAGILSDKYSKDILASESDSYFQLNLTLQAHYDVLRNLRAYVEFPYLAKLGFVQENGPLPGLYEFKANTGFGDFTSGAIWYTLSQDRSPVNLTSQAEVLLPFGQSRFDSEYQGYFELGNGFRALSVGTGMSRAVSPAVLLFANGSYVKRFPRTFSNWNEQIELHPDDVQFLSVGVGFLITKNYQFDIQIEQASIGVIKQGSYTLEPKYTYKSYGLKFIGNSKKQGIPPYTAFIGMEEVGGKSHFAFGYYWPIGLRLFGVDF